MGKRFQPETNDALGSSLFEFRIDRIPNVLYTLQEVTIPSISMGTAFQPSPLKDFDLPGDKVTYDDLIMNFIVDEHLRNYEEIFNWITGLGFPESNQQYSNLRSGVGVTNAQYTSSPVFGNLFSQGSLVLKNNLKNPAHISIVYYNMFPTSLSDISFTTTSTDYETIAATVTFKYDYFKIIRG